jgi:hypothetical protein
VYSTEEHWRFPLTWDKGTGREKLPGRGRSAISANGQETQYREIFSISFVISRTSKRWVPMSGPQVEHKMEDYVLCGCYWVYFIGRFERYSAQIVLYRLRYSE